MGLLQKPSLCLLTLALWSASSWAATSAARTIQLQCKGSLLRVEVADTDALRIQGLMQRSHLPDGEGMLFVFPRPQRLSFWMRNTPLPLSIAYLDARGVIREMYDLKPNDETSVISRSHDLVYAIEVPQGWWRRIGAELGDRVEGVLGALF